eukprot:GHVP01054672.1.p1 GENE.GHVP01054672.1~~GHVP01054672.1.p1  ORF type:complete len:236 (+),score=30.70 GHVP01054672.1:72-710(+)
MTENCNLSRLASAYRNQEEEWTPFLYQEHPLSRCASNSEQLVYEVLLPNETILLGYSVSQENALQSFFSSNKKIDDLERLYDGQISVVTTKEKFRSQSEIILGSKLSVVAILILYLTFPFNFGTFSTANNQNFCLLLLQVLLGLGIFMRSFTVVKIYEITSRIFFVCCIPFVDTIHKAFSSFCTFYSGCLAAKLGSLLREHLLAVGKKSWEV